MTKRHESLYQYTASDAVVGINVVGDCVDDVGAKVLVGSGVAVGLEVGGGVLGAAVGGGEGATSRPMIPQAA